MNEEEAYAEMKKRGWGFAWLGPYISVGPIANPDYEKHGERPLIRTMVIDTNGTRAVERAIEMEKRNEPNRGAEDSKDIGPS